MLLGPVAHPGESGSVQDILVGPRNREDMFPASSGEAPERLQDLREEMDAW